MMKLAMKKIPARRGLKSQRRLVELCPAMVGLSRKKMVRIVAGTRARIPNIWTVPMR